MRRFEIGSLAIGLFVGTACAQNAPVPTLLRTEIQRREQFHVVDDLQFRKKPSVAELGMIQGIGTDAFWSPGHSRDSLDEAAVRREMSKWKDYPGVFYIDIENWPTCYVADSLITQSLAKYSRVIDLVREVAPRLVFGVYSLAPQFGYWPIVGGDPARLREWERCNERLAPLMKRVDIVFPSLYTFYDDEAGWDKYATVTLAAARRYGKPVYAFLWPEYHDSNPVLKGKNIPGRVWRHELDLVRGNADGIFLWSVWQHEWDEKADWWVQTRDFVTELRRTQRISP